MQVYRCRVGVALVYATGKRSGQMPRGFPYPYVLWVHLKGGALQVSRRYVPGASAACDVWSAACVLVAAARAAWRSATRRWAPGSCCRSARSHRRSPSGAAAVRPAPRRPACSACSRRRRRSPTRTSAGEGSCRIIPHQNQRITLIVTVTNTHNNRISGAN